jgi:hypothetical protein
LLDVTPESRIVVEQTPQDDELALEEAATIERGDYKRDEQLRDHLHYCALALLWFGVIIFIVATSIWMWHMLTPESYHFLTKDQRSDLQSLLFAAVGSSLVTDYGRRILDRADRSN